MVIIFLLRLNDSYSALFPVEVSGASFFAQSPSGGSILMTVAPASAVSKPRNGPVTPCV